MLALQGLVSRAGHSDRWHLHRSTAHLDVMLVQGAALSGVEAVDFGPGTEVPAHPSGLPLEQGAWVRSSGARCALVVAAAAEPAWVVEAVRQTVMRRDPVLEGCLR